MPTPPDALVSSSEKDERTSTRDGWRSWLRSPTQESWGHTYNELRSLSQLILPQLGFCLWKPLLCRDTWTPVKITQTSSCMSNTV